MKKLYRFSAIALCVLPLFFTSCSDYLDRDDDDNITEADVFARYEKVNGLVSDVYAAAKKADRPLVFFEHFSNSAITDECEGTNVEGIFTHFATADGDDVAFEKQRSLFYEMIGNCKFKYIHCCNSAAMTYHHDEKSNMGRLGITMYGCSPNGEEETKFKQVMSLYTKVAMIKKIPAGDQVGYGLTYTAKEDEYIATLPIGYADGFIRKNQGRKVYINGKYYEIVGRVCMDQMMVRVDENVKIGDQVEIFGEHISLESMAKDLDTISYEVLCLISKRVPRVYVQDGQVKELL